jgi:thiosulfate dehydrogenase [quinone] large subunit
MERFIIAFFILRVALGLNICLHGIVRWRAGREKFSNGLIKDFEKIPFPAIVVKQFGLLLPIVETVIGVLLVTGLFTEITILTGSGLMLLLLTGKSFLADWQTVSLQMIYIAWYSLLEWHIQFNKLSLDHFFKPI